MVDVRHEVAGFLGCGADGHVVVVQHDADFVHEADLLFVVAGEVVGVGRCVAVAALGSGVGCHVGADQSGVHFGKEGGDIVTRDGGRRHDSGDETGFWPGAL